jgi:hypothetical protein
VFAGSSPITFTLPYLLDPVAQRDLAKKPFRAIILAAASHSPAKRIDHLHGITLQPFRESTFSGACYDQPF